MELKEIMTRKVEVIHPDGTLAEAAEKMKELNVGSLPVCDGRRLVGMVTDRDITVRATSEGRDPMFTKARDVMTADIIYCFEDQSVEEAARMMEEKQIRRLPILNRDKDLVGIVALGDLAVDAGEEEMVGETLQGISSPSRPQR